MPDDTMHPKTPDQKTEKSLEDTFPASDSPANTPPPGSRKAEQVDPDPVGQPSK